MIEAKLSRIPYADPRWRPGFNRFEAARTGVDHENVAPIMETCAAELPAAMHSLKISRRR
jgi:hypothetical protein